MSSFLVRPCASDRDPVDKFGTFMYDRGLAWVRETGGNRYHLGTDVPVGQGTTLYGCGDGVVTRVSATPKLGYIWLVEVRYEIPGVGTIRVQTQHMSRIDVTVGQWVTTRTVLGLSGGRPGTLGAGNSNGAHVHIQVYVNGHLSDPDAYLNSRAALAGGAIKPFPGQPAPEPIRTGVPMFNLVSSPDAGLIFVQGIDGRREGVQSQAHLDALLRYRDGMLTPGAPTVMYYGDLVGQRGAIDWYLARVNGPRDAAQEPTSQPHKFTAEEISALNAPVLAAIGASRQEILEAVGQVDEATLATFGLQRVGG